MDELDQPVIDQLSEYESNRRIAHAKLQAAIETYNTITFRAWQEVEAARDAYNGVVEELNSYQESLAEDIRSYIEGNQEEDEEWDASAHEQWACEFETPIDTVELEEPAELDIDEYEEMEWSNSP